jgi:hypothetical protein
MANQKSQTEGLVLAQAELKTLEEELLEIVGLFICGSKPGNTKSSSISINPTTGEEPYRYTTSRSKQPFCIGSSRQRS